MTKYAVEGGKLVRKGKFCPRCGMGVFLADHPDRLHCGRCGYTEFKPGVPRIRHKPSPKPISAPKKEVPKPVAEVPAVAGKGAAPGKGAVLAKGAAPAPAKGGALAAPAGKAGAKEAPKKEEVTKGKKK
jgi:ubiquitin-small subunit ribosomal protein S27Ae